jgi:hypothetical protein
LGYLFLFLLLRTSVLQIMFCPPTGPAKGPFASRRLNRRQLRMRQVAMEEALAAGWKHYNSDEESSDEEAFSDRLDDTETTDVSHGMSDGRTSGGYDIEDGSYFPNARSLEGQDDEDSDPGGDEDDNALVDDNLHILLDNLIQQSLSPSHDGNYVFQEVERKKMEMTSVVSLCTGEIAETRGIVEDTKENDDTPADPVSSTSSIASSRGDDEQISDADSLDLGVPTSMWPSHQKENAFIANTSTNIAAKRAIADLVQVSNVFPEKISPRMAFPECDIFEDDHSSDDEDEPHTGSEVFLFTEGARYSDQRRMGNSVTNDLFEVEESTSLFSPMEPSEHTLDEGPQLVVRKELKIDTLDNISQDQERCFGGIQLISPTFFNSEPRLAEKSASSSPAPVMSPLSSMVHPMNLSLFSSKDLTLSSRKKETADVLNMGRKAPKPVDHLPTSILKSEEHSFDLVDSENRRSNLATSFRSSTKTNRLAYHLSSGKKSMSKSERVYSKSYLPPNHQIHSTLSASLPPPSRSPINRGSLAILLVDIVSKIFEVVSIDIQQDTSVGDVLAKARTCATDPALSEQKYVSFCYGDQEFGAPMLPVNLVIDWEKHKTRPLVVAVPVGTTAYEMQSVKRVLWKNPKLRDWWKQEDPFMPKSKKKRDDLVAPPSSEKFGEPSVPFLVEEAPTRYERVEV